MTFEDIIRLKGTYKQIYLYRKDKSFHEIWHISDFISGHK